MSKPEGRFLKVGSLRQIKGRLHEVMTPYVYDAADERVFTVPVGFQTDGGSVPRPVWWLYPPFGDDAESAYVLHDYLYKTGIVTRGEADALMREAMHALGFRKSGRAVVWSAVRMGGWLSWRKHRKADVPDDDPATFV